jgi:glutamine amidotransferase
MKLGIVDVGIGNAKSVANVLLREDVPFKLFSDPRELESFNKVVLPGVGSFDANMKILNDLGFPNVLKQANDKGMLILGICLGAQLLLSGSDEGVLPGLNLIPGTSKEFVKSSQFKVPHMGWNSVDQIRDSELTRQIENNERFYFAHSFYMTTDNPIHSIAETSYGGRFSSIIQKDNCYGVQFHPEKSHSQGIQLLTNFANLNV